MSEYLWVYLAFYVYSHPEFRLFHIRESILGLMLILFFLPAYRTHLITFFKSQFFIIRINRWNYSVKFIYICVYVYFHISMYFLKTVGLTGKLQVHNFVLLYYLRVICQHGVASPNTLGCFLTRRNIPLHNCDKTPKSKSSIDVLLLPKP